MHHHRVLLKSMTGAATTLAATPRHRSQARVVAVVLINLSTGSSIMVTLVVTSPAESIMVPLVVTSPESNLTSDIVTQLGGGPVTTDN